MTVIPNARRVAVSAPWMRDWGGTQHYTMALSRPHGSLNSNDRMLHAHPGMLYEVRAAVTGGVAPYLHVLSNAPVGMTVNARTGVITWPNPQSNASNITLTVTDTKGTSVQGTWSITVATTRFRFIDNINGNDAWDGTTAAFVSGTTGPWKTLGKFQADGTIQTIGYFRTGTYNVYDTTNCVVSDSNSTRWGQSLDRPIMFLPYPGESPVFDHGYVAGVTEGLEWDFGNAGSSNQHIWIEGGEHIHGHNKTLRFVPSWNSNLVVWRTWFHLFGPGADGSNSAAMDFESGAFGSGHLENGAIQDVEVSHNVDDTQPNCGWKLYATRRMLIEDCDLHDLDINNDDEETIANKAGNDKLTVRGCTSYSTSQGAYGGNQNAAATGNCEVEMIFCYFQQGGANHSILMNHDHTSNAATRIHRCTFRGTVDWDELQTANGPYAVDRCVIVNGNASTDNPDGSGITHNIAPQDISRLTVTNHLFGPDDGSIIDSSGLLVNRSLVGQYGHEVPS